jgi:von Willebrand factor type A domain/Aerotolerance regulator N-terminal
MTLAQPLYLLLLPLLGVLLYLHRNRRSHRELEVGGLHLWRRVAAQHAPNRARWPRWTTALILQALVLLLLALALARPGPAGEGAAAGQGLHTILLLDASRASRATDVGPSRFGAELARAGTLIGGQRRGRVSVLSVSDQVWPLAARRSDLDSVRRSLQAATPTDGVARWEAAAGLVRALVRPGEQTRVVVLASASEAGAALASLRGLPGLSTELEAFGSAQPNAALTRASLMRTPSGTLLLSGAAIQMGKSGPVPLALTLDGRPLATQSLKLPDGRETAFEAELPASSSGVLQLSLKRDVLDADNHAWFVLQSSPPNLKVALVGPASTALSDAVRRALEAIAGVQVVPAATLVGSADAGLQVVTDPAVKGQAQVPTLWLNAAAPANTVAANTAPALPVAWDTLDPLSQGQDWSRFRVASGSGITARPASTALLTGAAGPLLQVQRAPLLEVQVNFDVVGSGWLQRPGFPVFLLRLLREVAPDTGLSLPPACTVGQPCTADAAGGQVVSAQGAAFSLSDGRFLPPTAGIYNQGGRRFAVNRFAGPEALLGAAPAGLPVPSAATPERWPLLLGAALLLLLTEALLARRGQVRHGWRPLLLALAPAALLLLALLDVPLPVPIRSQGTVTLRPGGTPASSGARQDAFLVGHDLNAALALGAAALPAGGGRLLIEDGPWLVGPSSRPLPANVRIERLPGPAPARLALDGPVQVTSGQAFDLHAQFVLDRAGPTTLKLLRGATVAYRDTRTLPAGAGRLTLPLTAEAPGTSGYTLSLTSPDAAALSLSASVAVSVQPGDSVLVVGNQAAGSAPLIRAMTVQGRTARAVSPAQFPSRAADLAGHEAVLLLDVPATALSAAQQAALDEYVRAGGLLVLAGGPHSFGPGGYYGTTLERLSPLSSRVVQDAPKLALGLLLDKSGSMNEGVDGGYSKLDLIKAAGLASAELLNPQSEVAVVAFDSAPKMVVPLQSARDLNTLRAQVNRIEAEGGTQVMRALSAMLKELGRSSAASKHMILLTDGIDGGIFSAETYGNLVGRIRASGITLSTVSVGSGMHVPLMKQLAERGGGVFQATQDWRDVPGLMASDTLKQGRSSVQLGQVAVNWSADSPFPSASAPANLGGYVRTTLKPGATLLAQTATDRVEAQPLAASWRSGLGSVTALPGGLGGWADSWTARPDFPALLSRLLRREDRKRSTPELSLNQSGETLTIAAARKPGELERAVVLDGPAGQQQVRLRAAGDLLTASPPVTQAGGYSVRDAGRQAALGVGWDTSPGLLGRVVAQADAVHGPAPAWTWGWTGAWPVWALLGLGLFLLGLARRYLQPAVGARLKATDSQADSVARIG